MQQKNTIYQREPSDIWDKASTDEELNIMAEQFVPMAQPIDPFWVHAARTVFSSAASRMRQDENRSVEKLVQLLLIDDISVLTAYLEGTPAGAFIEQEQKKLMVSIRNVLLCHQQIHQGKTQ